jgi:glycerol-3-phosphate acyltransferase PlsX
VRSQWPGSEPGGLPQVSSDAEAMRVAVDAMGGDQAPDAAVAGAVLAARELRIPVWIVGHEDVLQAKLAEHDTRDLPITIQHAPEVIRMEESPVVAIRRKPRCSIRVALDLLRGGAVDAVVSAGNSGALMAGALFTLGRLPGVERPAIAVPIPTATGHVILLDAGANVDAHPSHLVQFAVMGDIYARVLRGVEAPRVGVLSNGEEESKGTERTRATSAALRAIPLNFTGYVEGRGLCQGEVDVAVCDGFVGNAVLKAMEGFGELTAELLQQAFRRSWRTRLGYLLVRGALAEVRGRLDYSEYGGAPLLGVDGVAIVAHGSSGPRAIRNAIRVAHESARLEIGRQIMEAVRDLPAVLSPGGPRRRRIWNQLRERLAGVRDDRESPDGPAAADDDPRPAEPPAQG